MKNRSYNNIQFLNLGFNSKRAAAAVWPCFHQHNEVELMLVKGGYITYRFGGGIRKIRKEEVVCFWGAVPHQIIYVEPGARFEWISIPLELFVQWQLPENFAANIIRGEMLILQSPDFNKQLTFAQWEKDLRSDSETARRIVSLEAEAKLRRFAASLDPGKNPADSSRRITPFSPGNLGKIEQVNLYIANNYREKISIARIAAKVRLHPNYLVSLFRKHCGIGLVDFISRFRVLHAQRLLSSTNMKILDIAFDSGFFSASSFYEVFERICKQTPGEYRKNNSLHKL